MFVLFIEIEKGGKMLNFVQNSVKQFENMELKKIMSNWTEINLSSNQQLIYFSSQKRTMRSSNPNQTEERQSFSLERQKSQLIKLLDNVFSLDSQDERIRSMNQAKKIILKIRYYCKSRDDDERSTNKNKSKSKVKKKRTDTKINKMGSGMQTKVNITPKKSYIRGEKNNGKQRKVNERVKTLYNQEQKLQYCDLKQMNRKIRQMQSKINESNEDQRLTLNQKKKQKKGDRNQKEKRHLQDQEEIQKNKNELDINMSQNQNIKDYIEEKEKQTLYTQRYINKIQKEKSNLKDSLKISRNENKLKDEMIQKLKSKVQKFEVQMKGNILQKQRSEEAFKQAERRLRQTQDTVKELQTQNRTTKDYLNKQIMKNKQKDQNITKLRSIIQKVEGQIVGLIAENKKNKADNLSLLNTVKTAEDKYTSAMLQIRTLQEKLIDTQRYLKQAQNQIYRANNQLNHYMQLHRLSELEKIHHKQQVNRFSTKIYILEEQYNHMKQFATQRQNEITSLKQNNQLIKFT